MNLPGLKTSVSLAQGFFILSKESCNGEGKENIGSEWAKG
jgi:hypothetical protein